MAEEQKTIEKPRQTRRYSDDEISLIQNTFANNDELLFALRKLFLQLPLDLIDKQLIESVTKSKPVAALIRKAWLPTLDSKAPVNQVIDLWSALEIKDKSVEIVYPLMCARETLIEYLEERLSVVETGKEPINPMILTDLVKIRAKSPEKAYSDLLARNTMIGHTEQQIAMFQVLRVVPPTIEDKNERRKKNSAE